MRSQCRNLDKTTGQFSSSLPNCSKCKNSWILWLVLEIFKMWNQINSGRLSHVSSQLVMIPSSRALLSLDKRLPLDMWNQSGLQEKVFWTRLIHPEIILKESNLTTCKETTKQSLQQKGRRPVTQVETDKIKAQFHCRHLQQGRWLRVLQCRWNYRRTA